MWVALGNTAPIVIDSEFQDTEGTTPSFHNANKNYAGDCALEATVQEQWNAYGPFP